VINYGKKHLAKEHFTKVDVEAYECVECGEYFLMSDEAADHWEDEHSEDDEDEDEEEK